MTMNVYKGVMYSKDSKLAEAIEADAKEIKAGRPAKFAKKQFEESTAAAIKLYGEENYMWFLRWRVAE